MAVTQPHLANDAVRARVTLRKDLNFRRESGRESWMVEDPVAGDFFQLGIFEYEFAKKLDGESTIADALAAHCREYPESPIGEFEALELCQWLTMNQLAMTEGSVDAARMKERFNRAMKHRVLERVNPILFRFSMRRPKDFIDKCTNLFGWLFGAPATFVALLVFSVALLVVGENWSRFIEMRSQVFSPESLFAIATASILLKIIHEMGHAIAVRRYGGTVGEMGVLMVLFVPLAYVDLNSVWKIRSRKRRIHVALAGIYLELLIASLAVLLWCVSTNPTVQFLCFSVAVSAGFTTLLFNANPLMRFDGYYVLTDFFGCANLYSDANATIGNLARRCFLGVPSRPSRHSAQYRAILTTYGICSVSWKILVCASLLWAASQILNGIGVLLALVSAMVWFWPSAKWLWREYDQSATGQRRRLLASVAAFFIAMGSVSATVPLPGSGTMCAVAEYADRPIVRAKASGFVDQIHVQEGEFVVEGQPLITLRNESQGFEIAALKAEIAKEEVKLRQMTSTGENAAGQAVHVRMETLKKKLGEMRVREANLVVSAENAGHIVARNLDQLMGRYVDEGDELMHLVEEDSKEIRVLVDQTVFDRLREKPNAMIRTCGPDSPPLQATIERVTPRAQQEVHYTSLYTINGGPLPVEPVAESVQSTTAERYQLISPHFEAIATLTPSQSRSLRSGQRLMVRMKGDSQTLVQWLIRQ